MSQEPKFTASVQNGEPGSCFLAQVFAPSGEAVAQFEPTSPPSIASSYARVLAAVLNTPQHTDAYALAADIKSSIAELAGGRVFPDLLAAIDELAGFAVRVDRKPLCDEQIEPMFRARRATPSTGEKDDWYWYAWGVEDGERAHGITEEGV